MRVSSLTDSSLFVCKNWHSLNKYPHGTSAGGFFHFSTFIDVYCCLLVQVVSSKKNSFQEQIHINIGEMCSKNQIIGTL